MKKYRFRLQALLTVAEQREKALRIDVAKADGAVAEVRRQIDTTSGILAEWEGQVRESQRGRLEFHRVRELLRACGVLNARVVELRIQMQAAERKADEVRQRLTEAAQYRMSLERLRDKGRQIHNKAQQTLMVKIADDMVAVRATARIQGAHDSEMTGVSQ